MACHYVYYHENHPRDYKNQYQDHQEHRGDSLLAPPGTIISHLKVPPGGPSPGAAGINGPEQVKTANGLVLARVPPAQPPEPHKTV